MRHIVYTVLLFTLCAFVGCERRKTIPDKDLAAIFHDAMIVNAYIDNHLGSIDSLNIYEPIFEHYGYTTEDVRYTMSSFLRRKSANLSDVVNEMIEQIEQENNNLRLAVTKLDTIEAAAQRFARRRLVNDTMVVVKRAADTARLRYTIPVEGVGDYKISARYTIDESDKSRGRKFSVSKLFADSTKRRVHNSTMRNHLSSSLSTTISLSQSDSAVIALLLWFDDFSQATKMQLRDFPRPKVSKMTLEEVTVDFTPSTEHAVEMLYKEQLGIRILADTMFFDNKILADTTTL